MSGSFATYGAESMIMSSVGMTMRGLAVVGFEPAASALVVGGQTTAAIPNLSSARGSMCVHLKAG